MAHTMEPYPTTVGYIWYAPNHVRAFTRDSYIQAGGYDPNRVVCDDHDLLIRLYQVGPFIHLDECLYLQRVNTGRNTQRLATLNDQIQVETVQLYLANIDKLQRAWCEREGLKVLELGKNNRSDVYHQAPNSVGLVTAPTVLPYVPAYQSVEWFNHLYNSLAHGGLLLSVTPSTDSRAAFQNPQFQSYWNENSFWYYTNPLLSTEVGFYGKFQPAYLNTVGVSEAEVNSRILYVRADLVADKGGPTLAGPAASHTTTEGA